MELRHLRHFAIVAEEQHFGRASKRLAIVQPALTRQIQELEEELNLRLFDRVGRGVRLSNVGRAFLEDTRHVLAELDRVVQRAQLRARGRVGTLTVAFTEGMTDNPFVPTVLADFRRTAPDVELNLRVLRSHNQEAALREGQINLGFCYYLPRAMAGLQHSEPLTKAQVFLALSKRHRLVRKSKIFLRDLQSERFVWWPRVLGPPGTNTCPAYHDEIASACQAGGLRMNVVAEGPTQDMLVALVASGVGVTFVLDTGRPITSCVVRPVEDLDVELLTRAMWRSDDPSPILPAFLATLDRVHARMGVHVGHRTRSRLDAKAI